MGIAVAVAVGGIGVAVSVGGTRAAVGGTGGRSVAVGVGVSVGDKAASGVCVALAAGVGSGASIACSPPQAETSDTMIITANRRFFTFSSSLRRKTRLPLTQITRYRQRVFKKGREEWAGGD
jgi:hypothetical protein